MRAWAFMFAVTPNFTMKVGGEEGEEPKGIVRVDWTIDAGIDHVARNLDARYWKETQAGQDPFFNDWEVLTDIPVTLYPPNPSVLAAFTRGPTESYEGIVGRRTTKRLLAFGRRDMVLACFRESGGGENGEPRWER